MMKLMNQGGNALSNKFRRIAVIVLDSVGIGELPDAEKFGDKGSHTLGHIIERVPHIQIPNMQKLGLGNIADLSTVKAVDQPIGVYGRMAEISAGKDTMTGHWELMGLHTTTPFNVFADGFPDELIHQFVYSRSLLMKTSFRLKSYIVLVRLPED